MRVFNKFGNQKQDFLVFKPSVLYSLASPSTPETVIDKAVAKAESGDKVTVADVKDWKLIEAQLEAERAARETAERRASEFGTESNERRLKIRDLEEQINLLGNQPKPEPVIQVVEKIPEDYESVKDKAAKAEKDLEALKKEQTKLVNAQVKVKLQGYQDEVNLSGILKAGSSNPCRSPDPPYRSREGQHQPDAGHGKRPTLNAGHLPDSGKWEAGHEAGTVARNRIADSARRQTRPHARNAAGIGEPPGSNQIPGCVRL
jgi:hypothetical protein